MIEKELEKTKNLIVNLIEHDNFNSYLSTKINKKELKKELLIMIFDLFHIETEVSKYKLNNDRYKIIVELFYTYKLLCDEIIEDYTKYTINRISVNN